MSYVVTVNGRRYRSASLTAAKRREQRAYEYALAFGKPLPVVTIETKP